MARRAKMDAASATEAKGISPEDLKKAVAEISRQKKLASEYAGNAGKATSNAIERFGLEKTALTFSRRLLEMEEGKRRGVIAAFLDYSLKLDFFAQIDAFDDLADKLEAILAEIRSDDEMAEKGKAGVDPIVSAMIQ